MKQDTGPDGVPQPHPADYGCAYILDTDPAAQPGIRPACPAYCGLPRRPGSDYCAAHHALCHLRPGSRAEAMKGFAIEALADAVGGRQARPRPGSLPGSPPGAITGPPPSWFPRVEAAARPFFRQMCSCYVREKAIMDQAKRKPASPRASHPASDTAPSPERQRHGPVERLERPIADLAGRPSRPYRAVDTLAIMERRGSITAGMRQAGEDFRARFAVAQLDPLRAIDLSHLRLGEHSPRPDADAPGLRIEAARTAVWRAIQAVGGIGSPAGSCLWHVLGWEQSVKEWALEQGWSGRRVGQEAAAGILIAALGALESHFDGRRIVREAHFFLDKSGLM